MRAKSSRTGPMLVCEVEGDTCEACGAAGAQVRSCLQHTLMRCNISVCGIAWAAAFRQVRRRCMGQGVTTNKPLYVFNTAAGMRAVLEAFTRTAYRAGVIMTALIPGPVMSLLNAVRTAAYSVGLKEPWKITGSWTMPDYLHYLPSATEYRRVSPGSQQVKAKIPHDHPSLVYDIKYFVRDHRRNNKYTMRTVDAKPFDFEKMFASAPLKPDDVKHVARPGAMPTRGF